jgi:predicted permease
LIALVVAAILVAIAAGVLVERRSRLDAQRVVAGIVQANLWVLTPFASFFVIARLHLTAGVGLGLLLAYAELAIVGCIAYLLATRVLRLNRASTGALILVTTLTNTGYLGIPLAAALLGTGAIGAAIAFDSIVSGPMFYVFGFAIGAAFGTRATGTGVRARLRSFVRNPPLIAVIAGLLAPASLAPDALLTAAHVVIYALLPLGFFMVGVHLAAEADDGALRLPPPLTRPVATAIGLRLVLAPLLMLAFSALVVSVPRAYLFQAAMPAGINSLVVAHIFGLDLKLTASAVAWTTLLVVVVGVVAAAL